VETSAIAYRVADFLKQHPPFQSIPDADLRELAASGRVRFFEANEYILWQGEPHKSYVFVIQQGTVSLWDDGAGRSALRDMRGAGDLLGVESFTGAPCCLFSATSSSDVVIYALRTDDFERLVLSNPDARRFIEAYDTVSGVSDSVADRREPQHVALQELLPGAGPEQCSPQATVQNVARQFLTSGADAIAVVDDEDRLRGVVTANTIVAWAAAGADAGPSIGSMFAVPPPTISSAASVADAALALAATDGSVVAVTADGARDGRLQAVITSRDIARMFGDEPSSIIGAIRFAPGPRALRELSTRVRALALRHLSDSTAVEWLKRVVSLADRLVVNRLIALDGRGVDSACWCFCGTSGRGESFTAHLPELLVIANDEADVPELRQQYERIRQALADCGYGTRNDSPFEPSFHVASLGEWLSRYRHWLSDPIRAGMYRARPLFDLRAVHGPTALWSAVEACIVDGVDPSFLLVLANDCLANLPPLTFFQDAVLDKSGEQAAVFKLEESALQPLVDVGRVFGLATKRVLGTSTVERLRHAATLHTEQELMFVEAAETFRILLRQQARVGISQGTTGSELPPGMLSRNDRHVLKSGFRSILELLEYTRSEFWLESV